MLICFDVLNFTYITYEVSHYVDVKFGIETRGNANVLHTYSIGI